MTLTHLHYHLPLCAGIDGNIEAVTHGLLTDIAYHLLEHIKAFVGISHSRVQMSKGSEPNTLFEVVHGIDVIHPAVVHDSQHDHLFHFPHAFSTDFGFLLIIKPVELTDRIRFKLLCRQTVQVVLAIAKSFESVGKTLQVFIHQIKIPFLCKLAVHSYRNHDVFNKVVHHGQNVLLHILTKENLAALVIDNLSLLVHYVVVLENVFTDFEVASLYLLLSVFDGLGKHPCGNRLILHAELIHHILNSVAAEKSHQIIFQRDEELGLTRVSLTSGTTSQLIVNSSGLMPFRTYYAKSAQISHLLLLVSSLFLVLFVELVKDLSGLKHFRVI